jgi:DNA mismatch repair protein MSH5
MAYLNNRYGDIASDIRNIENKILTNLQEVLHGFGYVYNNLIDLCAEIDVCLAFANIAVEYNYVRPVISADKSDTFIYARKSRHPLVEIFTSSYVPNDICTGRVPERYVNCNPSKNVQAKLKIITGPNACGKTIYMKQVALLAYMCYIGSYVPAEYACIGDFDRIYTRINSSSNVSMHMSTFFIDLKQVCTALNSYTSKSLMVVDEFGKGTHSTDGPVLLAAFIRYLLKFDEKAPHALISTHYHEIFRENLLRAHLQSDVDIEYLSFEYMKESNEKSNTGLVYLYKLKTDSVAHTSCAIDVAQSVGIKASIVNRARQILEAIGSNKNIQSLSTDETNKKLFEYVFV